MRKIINGILFTGFSIQIALGLIWMCLNCNAFQEFAEHRSIVYGMLYTLTGRNALLMYLMQLAFGYFAGHRFLCRLKPSGRIFGIWGALALLTLPMAMQCHLAVLPWSFIGSLTLLQWSFAMEMLRGLREGGSPGGWACVGLNLCWILQALLLPEYRLLGGIPVLLTLLFCLKPLWRERRRLLRMVSAAILSCILAFGAGTAVKAASGIEDRSVSFALASRTVWPSLWSDHFGWPEEMQEALGEAMWEASFCADNMDRLIKPAMEEAFGKERADAYYREIALNSWTHRTSVILTQIRWDLFGYAMSPIALMQQLRGGNYDSYSGRNYEIMRNHTPVITKYYVAYGCWWFAVCIGLALLLTVICFAEKKHAAGKGKTAGEGRISWRGRGLGLLVCVCAAGAIVLWYTMRGSGMMDYKASFAVSSLWLVWALAVMQKDGTDAW